MPPACLKKQQTVPWWNNSLLANTYTHTHIHTTPSLHNHKSYSNATLATTHNTRANMLCLHPPYPINSKKHGDRNLPCPIHSSRTHWTLKTTHIHVTPHDSSHTTATTSIIGPLDPQNWCLHTSLYPHTQNRNAQCPGGLGQAPPVLGRDACTTHTNPQ